ncbi:hypothetical protein [Aestuariibacter salexigens]|uniref:hypothetical protein n=1 Tax=Aestuariibacter salexigens TaxID=226010 RepID=UPI000401A45A|nr:hypothetical protein [Aestuariibacter salexigens]
MSKTHQNLRQIIQLKKKINWGDLPAAFHVVTTSLSDLEGLQEHGFDHPVKRLLDRRNWSLKTLRGREFEDGSLEFEYKPRVILYRTSNELDFEVNCYPLIDDQEIRQFCQNQPGLPFNTWDPNYMRSVAKVSGLPDFMRHTYWSGDDADHALVEYANYLVEGLIVYLSKHLDIVEIKGNSIREIIEEVDRRVKERQAQKNGF